MDPMSEASSYLIPDWLERLVEESIEEVSNSDSSWPIKLLGTTTRKLVWNLCGTLGIHTKGIPGQVCRLVERYFAARFSSMSLTDTTVEEWDELKQTLVARTPLLVASAIQISGKMMSMANKVRPSKVQKVLKHKGISYTIDEITTSEFDFFQMLNFQLPMWTSVEAAELLATELGMPQQMLPGVAIIVDLAEYHRLKIEAGLIATATNYTGPHTRTQLRTLDLSAGAVVAAARHLNFKGLDPAVRLSALVRAPSLYLTCVSNLILQEIQEDESEPLILKKRKILTD